jgi:hypothetical protein
MKNVTDIYPDRVEQREATQPEIEARKELEATTKLNVVEAEAKAQAKAALLERLGITAEEATLLLS